MRNTSEDYFKFGPVVQKMSFKDIFYLELWWPFFFSEAETFVQFCKRVSRGTILWNY